MCVCVRVYPFLLPRFTETETDRQTNRQTGRDRQRQIETDRDRQREERRHRQRQMDVNMFLQRIEFVCKQSWRHTYKDPERKREGGRTTHEYTRKHAN